MDQAGEPQADPPHRHRARWSAVGGGRDVCRAGARDASRGNRQLQDRSLRPLGSGRPVACAVLDGPNSSATWQIRRARPRHPAGVQRSGETVPRIPTGESRHRSTSRSWPAWTVAPSGYVLCPSSRHTETTASCRGWPEAAGGWWCFGCGAGGAIYDLASLMLGGPTGQALGGEAFTAARQLVVDRFGQLR